MKRIISIVLTTILISVHSSVFAQDIKLAQERLQEFNKMRIAETQTPEDKLYSTLYQCYQAYLSILDTIQITSPDYEQAKHGMLEIHPYLKNGVAYHQNRGKKQSAPIFAQAYIDVTLLDAMTNHTFIKDEQFATIAYIAASDAFNTRKYEQAIKYFAVYISSGDLRQRETVYAYMIKACLLTKNRILAISVLEEAIQQYPNNYEMLKLAINYYQEEKDYTKLEYYALMAIKLKPNEEALLEILGKVYEDNFQFEKALNVYQDLDELKPGILNTTQHIALNYFNLGVLNFNKAALQDSETEILKYSGIANEYFVQAESKLEAILKNVPNTVKYIQALAIVYDCLGKAEEFKSINDRLLELGAEAIESNIIPTLITHSSESLNVSTTQQGPTSPMFSNSTKGHSNVLRMLAQQEDEDSIGSQSFSAYAKKYVEPRVKAWQDKDPYETVAEYQMRVNEDTREAKVKELLKIAEANYIKYRTRGTRIRIEDMTLKTYDADHETFLIQSEYGELIVPISRERDEARLFESNWSSIQVKEPEFFINNDTILLSALTFVTPTGFTYHYDGKAGLKYTETVVDMSFAPINNKLQISPSQVNHVTKATKQTLTVEGVKSDVDLNIPEINIENENLYAVIIANENYKKVSNVPYALNDGETFAKYCEKTLGIPQKNISLHKDVSFGDMISVIGWIKDLAMAKKGNMELIFYYAGHGIPDESSKDAFLLPIDSDGKTTRACYSLNDIYNELGALNAQSVMVFLDACFSGAKRDGGMIAEARGVAIEPRPLEPTGNMVVFSAVSDNETALPYEDKVHGMFTYYLLKKLQETEGNVTLKELSDYIYEKVISQSVLINKKKQTPTLKVSIALSDKWQTMKLRKN